MYTPSICNNGTHYSLAEYIRLNYNKHYPLVGSDAALVRWSGNIPIQYRGVELGYMRVHKREGYEGYEASPYEIITPCVRFPVGNVSPDLDAWICCNCTMLVTMFNTFLPIYVDYALAVRSMERVAGRNLENDELPTVEAVLGEQVYAKYRGIEVQVSAEPT